MTRVFATTLALAGMFVASSFSAFADDEITADQRLPEGVLMYISIPDVLAAHESFQKTGMSELIHDPALDDFRKQLIEKFEEGKQKAEEELGVTLSDLASLFAGELTLAVVRPVGQTLGGVFFMDIGENEEVLNKLIAKALEADEDEKVEQSTETIEDQEINVFTITVNDDEDADPVTVAYFIKDEKLVVASSISILESVLENWAGDSEESFATNEIYTEIIDKCSDEDSNPALLYYFDPVGLLATGLGMNPDTQLFAGMVYSPAFGLTGFKGLGGTVELATEEYDSISRAMYYVDGPASGILKIFEFRPTISAPPAWVPAEAGQFIALDWNIKGAYEAIESIYDSFTGPGKFDQVITGLSQQGAANLHIKNDIVDVLSGQIQWYLIPSEKPEDMLGTVAIGVNDAAKGQRLIDGIMKLNGEVETSEFKGVQLSAPAGEDKTGVAAIKDNMILIAKDTEQLKLTLSGPAKTPLVKSEEYKQMAKIIPEKVSLLAFQDPADSLAAPYEKARAGDFDSVTEGQLDLSVLPPFEVLRKYLTPSASYFVPDEHGTLGVQFSLKRKK
ncbi:hypothetical protein SH661x_001984 [Planctomicrobium sp. SH661]|uniref:hypothetical protein n=1 Tax=Planctomicrobium sp. SH661 TaxID=3448124 RepID=UPI003F5B8786